MVRYAEALERFRDELDSLNVYPVPDGDTGTNLLQTQRAVVEALGSRGDDTTIAEAIARSSLRGARGNSGVILSQTLRGLCEGVPVAGADAAQMGVALRTAASASRAAVARPQEGTVLTVLDDAAAAGSAAVADGQHDVAIVLEAALEAARDSLARTAIGLPELRAAGVVDAGAKGAVLLLDALHAVVSGGSETERPGPMGPVGVRGTAAVSGGEGFGYEVQALLETGDGPPTELRGELAGLGESLALVGGGGMYNVHVHTDHPKAAIAAIRAAGHTLEVSVVSLSDQVAACAGAAARAVQAGVPTCAVVAVADGVGLAAAFRSLGTSVVAGGPGSGARIAAEVERSPAPAVLVIPNEPPPRAVARAACEGSSKQAAVVPADAVPAGLAAAAAFHPDVSLETNAAAMGAAARRCRSEACASPDPQELVMVAKRVRDRVIGAELLTLIAGEGVSEAEAAMSAAALRAALPDLEVQLVHGGQPGAAYLLGVE